MRPSLGSRVARPDAALAVGLLKFVAFGGSWPLGQPDYRTHVRRNERLRKAVYGCEGLILGPIRHQSPFYGTTEFRRNETAQLSCRESKTVSRQDQFRSGGHGYQNQVRLSWAGSIATCRLPEPL